MKKAFRSWVVIFPVVLMPQWIMAQALSPAAGIFNAVAGTGTTNYYGDGGLATSADLDYPEGVAVDASGNLYIADTYNFVVRKVSASSGIITTVAGNHTEGYSGDGGSATNAMLSYPDSIAVDASGNIYIADSVNNRIRKVTVSNGIITTVAGNGTAGYSGDGGQATSAKLDEPQGVAVDASGNLYILDTLNYRIRKVQTSTGVITTVAGDGIQGYSGDGEQATNVEISPAGIAVDASANLYIADSGNDRIRKVTASTGIISTVAGDGTAGYSGDGQQATNAEVNDPGSVAVDAVGNLYIADNSNYRIRKVMGSTGDITTVAGIGATGLHGKCAASGLGGLAISAEICHFVGIAVDSAGDFYFAGGYGASEVYGVGAVKTSPTITWPTPAAITYGTALSGIQLDATANTAGTFAYTPSSGTVLSVGSQTLSVLFTPTDTIDYTTATASVTLQVNKVTPNVSVFCSPNPITYGGANSICTISVSNGATGTVTLAINGSAWTTVTLSSSEANAQFSSTYGVGTFTVGATYNGDGNNNSANGSGNVTVSQRSQSISFTAPVSPVPYGVAPITLSATGGASGNPVVFSVISGPGSISGNTLTITGAGTVMVAANQAGNTDYSAAAQVTGSVAVNAAVLTVTANNASRSYGTANPTFSYTVTGFVNVDTSSVVGGSAAETTSATSTSAPGSYPIAFSSEALTATNYTFSYVSGTLIVSQAFQTITFNAPATPVTYGVSPISLSAIASSGLTVTFRVSSGSCSVSGATLTVTGVGTCVVAANQAGNADYTSAAAVSHGIVVSAAVLTVTANNASRVYGAANPTFTPSYSGFVNGDTTSVLSGAPSLTTTATSTSIPGTYTITVAAGTLAASNYTFSFVNGTLTVTTATQTISFTAPASPVTYGVSPIFLNATASSGLAVTFSVSSGPCTVSNSTLTVTGAGTCVVAANQTGNTDYSAAATVSHSIVVNAAVLTVTANNASRVYGAANPTFTVSFSGLVNGDTTSVLSGAPSLTTTATSTSMPGTYTITVAAGTLVASNYTFSFVNGTLTVTAATQTISFLAPASPVTYGVSPISLSATASSGLAVAFSITSGPCTVSGSTLTVVGAGTCVVAANQPGNADYTAAAAVVQSLVINKESVIVNSMSSLSPSLYGDNVALTFTFTGSGITPTGTVTISDGANTLATISLDAGIATYNTSALIAGKHSLTAVYSGDNNYE